MRSQNVGIDLVVACGFDRLEAVAVFVVVVVARTIEYETRDASPFLCLLNKLAAR